MKIRHEREQRPPFLVGLKSNPAIEFQKQKSVGRDLSSFLTRNPNTFLVEFAEKLVHLQSC